MSRFEIELRRMKAMAVEENARMREKQGPGEADNGLTTVLRRNRVMDLRAQGISNEAISQVLGVSYTTVGNDVYVMRKRSRALFQRGC